MKKLRRVATMGMVLMGMSSLSFAANEFGMSGFIESGWLFHYQSDAFPKKQASFHAREANIAVHGKIGTTEGRVELAMLSGEQNVFYSEALATPPAAYGLTLKEAYINFHPNWMGSDSFWKWGVYQTTLGFEGRDAPDNKFLSRSLGYDMIPKYVIGTGLGKNFGPFNAALHLVNTVQPGLSTPTTSSFDGTANGRGAMGGILSAGIGSKDTFYLDLNGGLSRENQLTGFLLDATLGATLMDKLALAFNFVYNKNALLANRSFTAGTTLMEMAWALSVLAHYNLTDDLGAGLRFDYDSRDPNGATLASKTMAFALGINYAMHKNVMGKLEYRLAKFDDNQTAPKNVSHILGWSATMHW